MLNSYQNHLLNISFSGHASPAVVLSPTNSDQSKEYTLQVPNLSYIWMENKLNLHITFTSVLCLMLILMLIVCISSGVLQVCQPSRCSGWRRNGKDRSVLVKYIWEKNSVKYLSSIFAKGRAGQFLSNVFEEIFFQIHLSIIFVKYSVKYISEIYIY